MTEIIWIIALIAVTALWIVDGVTLRRRNKALWGLVAKGAECVAEAKRGVEKIMEEREVAADYADLLLHERGPAALEEKLALEGACHKSPVYPLYIWLGRIHAEETHRRLVAAMILHFGSSEGRTASVAAYCKSPTRDHISGFLLKCSDRELMRVERNDLGQIHYITMSPQKEELEEDD